MAIHPSRRQRIGSSLFSAILLSSLFLAACGAGVGGSNSSGQRTVTGTKIDTYWTSSGTTTVPFDWTQAAGFPKALVPQPGGSFATAQGSGKSDGTFSISSVSSGYYWLQTSATSYYWTSADTIDLGADFNGIPAAGRPSNFFFTFNVSGLDPLQGANQLTFLPDLAQAGPLVVPLSSPAGATTWGGGIGIAGSTIDYTKTETEYVQQYEPESLGVLSVDELGTQATLSTVSSVTFLNNVTANLVRPPQASFDLSVRGSAWAPLTTNIGPVSSLPSGGTDLAITALPFMTGGKLPANFALSIPLLVDAKPSSPPSFLVGEGEIMSLSPGCQSSGPLISPMSTTFLPGNPGISMDQDFGLAHYGDPFPSNWDRVFTFCESAIVAISVPGATTPLQIALGQTQTTALPTSAVSPLISQVLNPMINGMNLFTASTVGASGLTLSWIAPSGTTPSGYEISVIALPPSGATTSAVISESFYTEKTTATLPTLTAGSYLFIVSAILDGAANFESSPNRSALPTANMSVVSAPISITTGP